MLPKGCKCRPGKPDLKNRVIIYKSCWKKGVVDPAYKLILGGRTENEEITGSFYSNFSGCFCCSRFCYRCNMEW
jgi:hypothetical protein